jgi:hypothetical protein
MTNNSDCWRLGRLVWGALAAGTAISGLLLTMETLPRHAPRPLAMPGWIAVMFLWGFEGGRGAWPWVVFMVANAVAYSYFIFLGFVILGIIFRRRGAITRESTK